MGILRDLGRSFVQGFAEGIAEATDKRDRWPVIEAREVPRLPTVEVPPDFGTPVADSLEGLGEELISAAQMIRRHEPLPLEIMRRHGLKTARANMAAIDAMGALMRDLG